jgi:hypothetical protein
MAMIVWLSGRLTVCSSRNDKEQKKLSAAVPLHNAGRSNAGAHHIPVSCMPGADDIGHRIPGLGGLPELLAFYCPRCREALTVEAVSGQLRVRASDKIAA